MQDVLQHLPRRCSLAALRRTLMQLYQSIMIGTTAVGWRPEKRVCVGFFFLVKCVRVLSFAFYGLAI